MDPLPPSSRDLGPEREADPGGFALKPPAITLPKGGGAIGGMGEKLSANAVTGTGSMSIPLATTAGRGGFGPQLSLRYDSGAGNGPFGFGWGLALPAITRKTSKGLPRYLDGEAESDTFILSEAEDLVPALVESSPGVWEFEPAPPRTLNGQTYHVRLYRPRTEGAFARIERWSHASNPTDVFWRTLSRDDITTWYGRTRDSQLVDPDDGTRIFSWLICERYDDRGNGVVYEYKAEDSAEVVVTRAHERNRSVTSRGVGRYIKHIRYGNVQPYLPDLASVPPTPMPADWCFEVVFDYGEHDASNPRPGDALAPWKCRPDPFSSYRAGFEVRTYRLCQRILLFHHFRGEAQVGIDCLVQSIDLRYSHDVAPTDPRNAVYAFLVAVGRTRYQRDGAGYLSRTLPPLEFTYTEARVDDIVRDIEPDSIDNLPIGLGERYHWVDLDGEGLTGVLTEQESGWYYKRNLSPVSLRDDPVSGLVPSASFAPLESVIRRPTAALVSGRYQLLDLAGDGQLDFVETEGPTPGFYERTMDEDWKPLRAFKALPRLNWRDPNLRFIDLTGDGHADVLITEDEALSWHASLGELGFGGAQRVQKALDEEIGPRLVFADETESVFLADLSGDGLTDLVRIRNGEVCYWPNMGYGRFGAKVAMDEAPWFDAPDVFDGRRIRLADIDGSGTTDIVYFAAAGVKLFFNCSGNSWGEPHTLGDFPQFDSPASAAVVDLLGNGTACLVWSSSLPDNIRRPMRYVDLMGGRKPHLLVTSKNNLGAETRVSYAPSTRFYLQDKLDGKPWVTRLPFPVQCVERITVIDKWRGTTFSTTFSYHNGYFDSEEREFRGFGRVERTDCESYGVFASANPASPYVTDDRTLYQPPVKTVSWYHTGAPLDRDRILSQFAHEYFPRWYEDERPGVVDVLGGFQEAGLPEPDIDLAGLNAEEWGEALRACKGMPLREEVYELDVDALEVGKERRVKLFAATVRNCRIRRLQPRQQNRYAVFLVGESETVSYHYELDLTTPTLTPDPRVEHSLNLQLDQYGNILQQVTVGYPRFGMFSDPTLTPDAVARVRAVQSELHVSYKEMRYTDDVELADNHRVRVPCEVLTYELTGFKPSGSYFAVSELQAFRLSEVYQATGTAVGELAYHELPPDGAPRKRIVQHVRTLFYNDDAAVLAAPLPLGRLGKRALTYEAYRLVFTDSLLTVVFGSKLTTTVKAGLSNPTLSGYLSGAALAALFPTGPTVGEYWARSGIAGYSPVAAAHFYLATRYIDAFGSALTVAYDARDLFISSSTDSLGNTTSVERFDYRTMKPAETRDVNDNLTEIGFDVVGMPVAIASKGKGAEGDSLAGLTPTLLNPPQSALASFFDSAALDEAQARSWLANATARYVYDFGERPGPGGAVHWMQHPACTCGILRERHTNELPAGEQSPLLTSFQYSDGVGSMISRTIQAEPAGAGQPLRWIVSGKVVFNNKGQRVQQYEPYFSGLATGHRFEDPIPSGVVITTSYDALGRSVRTDAADGSYERVEFSPWHVRRFDRNDTVKEVGNEWFAKRSGPAASVTDQRAAALAADHADTPAVVFLDSVGRDVVSVLHNRIRDAGGVLHDERYGIFTKVDAQGQPLWIRDARANLVTQFVSPPVPGNQPSDPVAGFVPCYDLGGVSLYQYRTDSGGSWMLSDAAGSVMFTWNDRGFATRVDYDSLHRPVASFVIGADPSDPNREIQFERRIYGDTPGNGLSNAKALNLAGRLYQKFDGAGVVTFSGKRPVTADDEAFDFKGNLLRSRRQLLRNYEQVADWSLAPALEAEIFESSGQWDALNRPRLLVAPHSDRAGTHFHALCPRFNARGLLVALGVWLELPQEPRSPPDPVSADATTGILDVEYDAKGQRTRIEYGNGTQTIYTYEPDTFRLSRLETVGGADHLQDLGYTFDPVGNVTDVRDGAQQTVFFNNGAISADNSYAYDALYRLMSAEGREHAAQNNVQRDASTFERIVGIPFANDPQALQRYAEQYEYDAVGNILTMRHVGGASERWVRRYQYALDSNRLLSTRQPGDAMNLPSYVAVPGYTATYAHDAGGNMTAMPHLAGMKWDFRDRLTFTQPQAVGPGVTPVQTFYVYDDSGTRVRKVTRGQSGARREERIYLGGFELFRKYAADGETLTLERETVHVMDGQRRVALVEIRTVDSDNVDPAPRKLTRYQMSNHLGSAVLELDAFAQIISYEEFHPFGSSAYEAARSLLDTAKRYRFTGQERDDETGFSYHGARYYAPWLGRWTSRDPLLRAGLNGFRYVENNPLRLRDPQGSSESDVVRATNEATAYSREVLDLHGEFKSTQSAIAEQTANYNAALAKYLASNGKDIQAMHAYEGARDKLEYHQKTLRSIESRAQELRAPEGLSAKELRDFNAVNEIGSFSARTRGQMVAAQVDTEVAISSASDEVFAAAEKAAQNARKADELLGNLVNMATAARSELEAALPGAYGQKRLKPPTGGGGGGGSGGAGGESGGSGAKPSGAGNGTAPAGGEAPDGHAPNPSTEASKAVGTEVKVGEKEVEKAVEKGLTKGVVAKYAGKVVPIVGIGVGAYFVRQDIKEGNYGRATVDAAEAIPVVGDVVLAGDVGYQVSVWGIRTWSNFVGDITVSHNKQLRDLQGTPTY